MISVLKQCQKLSKNKHIYRINVRYFARAISGDRSTPLTDDTLTGRFLSYLDNNLSKATTYNDKIGLVATIKTQPQEIRNFDTNGVNLVLSVLNDRTVIKHKNEFKRILELVDVECCSRLHEFSTKNIFDTLTNFVNAVPHQITKCQFFHSALDCLVIHKEKLNKDQLVHLLFFIGFLKKNYNAQNMIRQCLKLFDHSTINRLMKEDLCIICNSTFKTSTKIKNHLLLDKIKLYINDNLTLLNDPAVFITLIKTLRHNRYQDDDILNSITCTIFFNGTLKYYSFSAMCHILALYADYLYYDESILKVLTEKCLNDLKHLSFKSKDTYLQEQPRMKDIKRFLWALTNLNYKISREEIEGIILPQIEIRVDAGEFTNDVGSMFQIILYLWMMNYKACGLIDQFMVNDLIQKYKAQNLPNQQSLNLLLTSIYYEDPNLFQKLKIPLEATSHVYNQDYQLAKRPVLRKVIQSLKSTFPQNKLDTFQINCQVPYLNIVGITGYQKKIYKTVNIEILDEYTTLKNSDNVPSGLMQLKMRILDKCDEALIVICEDEFAGLTDLELQQFLEDEINLVC
ncbi:uncharacterized protein LOC126734789 [Anthonomus grandis grandis]|uniref:uncharacterized protein LOC126734789 n=1 Tax=Anthonomus grandis grandis TaxID=2921223 RepID=UPI002165269E|nr:uncharacterized protein LOC126734789 [Anthonomus grandis grandis]